MPTQKAAPQPNGTTDAELSTDELQRYGRHLTLPDVGREGQEKLKASSVLIVGAGGLGSPLAMYLAAAGVGRLGIVDFDHVEASNLQRQVLYGQSDVGRPKLEAAEERLREINPHVEVERYEARLSSDNVFDVIEDGPGDRSYDLVADGTDNFPTRYLVNDACVMAGVPNVYGSIFRFEGQVSVFATENGPCYRCAYEEPPPPGLVPSCAEGGVLGVLPGLVGSMQATEAIKVLLGIGEPLVGRLLLMDALGADFRTLTLNKNPDCPVCSDDPEQTELIDYEAFCGLPSSDSANGEPMSNADESVPEISVTDYAARRENADAPFLLDVREPHEYEITNLGGTLIPLGELEERLGELDTHRGEEVIVHCRTGGRSAEATKLLRDHGFDAKNLRGGVHAWSDEVDPDVPKY
jgi:adenylyltransferase/sulfurtransferase